MTAADDVIAGVPRWAWEMVAAVEKYEDEHDKILPGEVCLDHVVRLIPEEIRRIAGVLREVGVL